MGGVSLILTGRLYFTPALGGRKSFTAEGHVKWTFMEHPSGSLRESAGICGQTSPILTRLFLPDAPHNVIHPFPADYGNAQIIEKISC